MYGTRVFGRLNMMAEGFGDGSDSARYNIQ